MTGFFRLSFRSHNDDGASANLDADNYVDYERLSLPLRRCVLYSFLNATKLFSSWTRRPKRSGGKSSFEIEIGALKRSLKEEKNRFYFNLKVSFCSLPSHYCNLYLQLDFKDALCARATPANREILHRKKSRSWVHSGSKKESRSGRKM